MADKALTVAIAGALAAPMAAQAVDVSVSGHVSRALVHVDSDDSANTTQVKDYGSSGSRFRIKGSGEYEGGTASVRLEYAAGAGGKSPTVRYADASLGGSFGKLTIGQSDQAGESSAYSDKSGVTLGHGQEFGGSGLAGYFGSLDGGGSRNEVIRYDTPKLGMAGLAVSAGNGDQYSAGATIGGDMGGTAFGARLGYLKQAAVKTAASAEAVVGEDGMGDVKVTPASMGAAKSTIGASAGVKFASGFTLSGAWAKQTVDGTDADPSYFQSTVGYVFGDSSVGVSWYQSSDFKNKGSQGTMLGVGFKHTLPKPGVDFYATVQTLDVEDKEVAMDTKDTVMVVATRVRF